MSYILDALRKAERDRNLGRTPSLGDVTAPHARPPSQRPSNRTLGLIALVVVLLICTVALWPRHRATQPSAPPATVAAAPAPPAPVAAPAVAPAPAPAPELSAAPADGTISDEVPADSIDDLMDDAEAPADETGTSDAEANPAAPPPAAVAPESIPTVSAPAAQPSEPPAAEEPEAASDVPLLRDMPADYRGAFPQLRVDVHVYDDDPARRWTLINGHKAAEGTTLAEGPTVSRITPEGIVFDFRGRTVLIPLNR